MKIVVIGGSGFIGSMLVKYLRLADHDVVAGSRASGVDVVTGEGLAEALKGAQVVVDVSNSPSFEDKAVLDFFETSGRNLSKAEAAAGVKHHLALSVVGSERLAQSGYFRGKIAQEKLIRESGIPYTIVQSTQFIEFLAGIADSGTSADRRTVRLSTAFVQPIASDDVASAVADLAVGAPKNGVVEIAGPERVRLSELIQRFLTATRDPRVVVPDVHAPYFGAELQEETLMPTPGARLGVMNFDGWVRNRYRPKA